MMKYNAVIMCTCFPSTHLIVSSEKCTLISSFILFPVIAQYNDITMCPCFPAKYVLMLICNFTWFPVSISAGLYVYQISPSTKMSRASLLAGTFSLAVCIFVWVVIAFFLTENQFNPIQDALDDFFPKLEVFLQNNGTFQGEKFNETTKDLKNYVENIRAFCPDVITATLGISVVYALSTIIMMIATEFQLSRVLMIPYMVLQLFIIIIMLKINFFQILTLALMSRFSSTSLLVTFILTCVLSILTVLASTFLIYYINKKFINKKFTHGVMLARYFVVAVGYTASILFTDFLYRIMSMAFSQAYFSVVLKTIISLHIPFAMCLLLVWRAFVSFEMEPKNTK